MINCFLAYSKDCLGLTSQTFWMFQNVLKFNSKRLCVLGESGQEKKEDADMDSSRSGRALRWPVFSHFLFLLARVPFSPSAVPQLPPHWNSSSMRSLPDTTAFSSSPIVPLSIPPLCGLLTYQDPALFYPETTNSTLFLLTSADSVFSLSLSVWFCLSVSPSLCPSYPRC